MVFLVSTSPSLVALPRVSFHGFRLFEVRFILDLGEELVDWFFENHVDPLPHPTLVVNQALLMLFEQPLIPGVVPIPFSACLMSSFNRANIQPGT